MPSSHTRFGLTSALLLTLAVPAAAQQARQTPESQRAQQAYESQRASVLARSRPISDLPEQFRRRLAAELLPWPRDAVPPTEQLRWLPVLARQASWTLFVDPTGMPVAFAPFDVP